MCSGVHVFWKTPLEYLNTRTPEHNPPFSLFLKFHSHSGNMTKYFSLIILFFALLSCGPKEDAMRIACVGDSITFGSGIRFRNWRSYPARLQKLVGRDFHVANFGKSGATLLEKGDLSYRVQKEYEQALSFVPEIVIIKLGTNDSKDYNWEHGKDFYQDYMSLIAAFRKELNNPRIIICKPVPVFQDNWAISNAVVRDEIIPVIDEVVKDAKVELIDLYQPFSEKEDLFPDGVHPNAAGAAEMAEHVAKYLENNPEPK